MATRTGSWTLWKAGRTHRRRARAVDPPTPYHVARPTCSRHACGATVEWLARLGTRRRRPLASLRSKRMQDTWLVGLDSDACLGHGFEIIGL